MMLGLRSVTAWAMALVAMASFPSAVVTAPVDDTGASNSVSPRGVSWAARHRMTSADYQTAFNQYSGNGYRLTCVSGYTISNSPRYAAIWDTSGGASWVAKHGMTSSQYQAQFNTFVSQGYRPILVDGYPVVGTPQFAAIWDKSTSAGWVARHDLSSNDYQKAFDTYTGQGFRLRHVSGYASGGQALYAAIWEKPTTNVAWMAHHGMTNAQYQATVNSYANQGYRLIHVDGYVVNNVDYYAAIWDKSPVGAWVARHGLDSNSYQTEFDNWVKQGFRLTVVSGYTLNGNQDRYAAIWVKQ